MLFVLFLYLMKSVVYFSAGIGDAVLLIPLIKALRKREHSVDGIFTAQYSNREIFSDTDLLDNIIILDKGRIRSLYKSAKHFKEYHNAYLNFFAATRTNLLGAKNIARNVFCIKKQKDKVTGMIPRINVTKPLKEIHDASQNLRMLIPGASDDMVNTEDFYLEFKSSGIPAATPKYFTIELSAGNNILKYKNWKITYWIEFLKMASQHFAKHNFILLGDSNEQELAQKIMDENIRGVFSVCGKTSIKQVMNYLYHCQCFIGPDGGLMHLSNALGKPTFTLWGISNPGMYGYSKLNSANHRIMKAANSISHSWIEPLSEQELMKDHYLDSLIPEDVFREFTKFAKSLNIYVKN